MLTDNRSVLIKMDFTDKAFVHTGVLRYQNFTAKGIVFFTFISIHCGTIYVVRDRQLRVCSVAI
jgi:hypothetical protein